jgi:hypothetical protein
MSESQQAPNSCGMAHSGGSIPPLEKSLAGPASIEYQVKTTTETKICAVDLNLGEQIAVCTIQTFEGTILATKFIGEAKRYPALGSDS